MVKMVKLQLDTKEAETETEITTLDGEVHQVSDILLKMDDDDFYPHTRVSHAVETLENNSLYDVVGCDNISIYFGKPEEKTYKI